MFALFLLLWLAICAGMVYAAFLVHPLVGVLWCGCAIRALRLLREVGSDGQDGLAVGPTAGR